MIRIGVGIIRGVQWTFVTGNSFISLCQTVSTEGLKKFI